MASAAQTQFVSSKPDLDDLTKRRFFYRPAFDIYGGTAGAQGLSRAPRTRAAESARSPLQLPCPRVRLSARTPRPTRPPRKGLYTYGPPGCALKNNLVNQWRKHFVIEDSMMEIEDPVRTRPPPPPTHQHQRGVWAALVPSHWSRDSRVWLQSRRPHAVRFLAPRGCRLACGASRRVAARLRISLRRATRLQAVTPYRVLEASGHVERFSDFMVRSARSHGLSAPQRTCALRPANAARARSSTCSART